MSVLWGFSSIQVFLEEEKCLDVGDLIFCVKCTVLHLYT